MSDPESSPFTYDFPFAEATVSELQAQMTAGTLRAADLAAAYIKRIHDLDAARSSSSIPTLSPLLRPLMPNVWPRGLADPYTAFRCC
jgi:hypothetical protein